VVPASCDSTLCCDHAASVSTATVPDYTYNYGAAPEQVVAYSRSQWATFLNEADCLAVDPTATYRYELWNTDLNIMFFPTGGWY